MEIKPFGIKSNDRRTRCLCHRVRRPVVRKFAAGLDIYADLKAQVREGMKTMERGDPQATPEALFQVVDSANPPLRIFLGSHNLPQVRAAYQDRLELWENWQLVASSAQVKA